jgi:hypothetical protein
MQGIEPYLDHTDRVMKLVRGSLDVMALQPRV